MNWPNKNSISPRAILAHYTHARHARMAQFWLKIAQLSFSMATSPLLKMIPSYGLRPRLWLLVRCHASCHALSDVDYNRHVLGNTASLITPVTPQSGNVWVNSKSDHPPPGQIPGHLTFLNMNDQFPHYMAWANFKVKCPTCWG